VTSLRRIACSAVLLVAGAASAAPSPESGYGLPRDASVDGGRVDWLIRFTSVAGVVIFLIVGAVLLHALVRHRRSHAAVYDRGSKASIAVVVGFVTLVGVAVDGTLFVHTLGDMNRVFWNFAAAEAQPDAVRIEVEAHQWSWLGRYPGSDGRFGTPDDVVTVNDLRVPLGAPVLVQLASVDVIHSMNLPHFRVKQDAVPGQITRLTFRPAQAGEYEIACAQHCGPNHYKMRGILTVLPAERYRDWLRAAEADARRAYDPEDAEAHWGWNWRTE
jgi:cytochrome c oxidase subunit II